MPIIPKELFPNILKVDLDLTLYEKYRDEHKEDEYPELGYLLENNMTDFTLYEHWGWINIDYDDDPNDNALSEFDAYVEHIYNYFHRERRIKKICANPRFQERFDIITSRFAGTYLQQEVKDILLKQDIQFMRDDIKYVYKLEGMLKK